MVFTKNNLGVPAPLKSCPFFEMISKSLRSFLGSSAWHTKSFLRNDFEVPELLLKWFQGGGQWLLKWFQGMGSSCWKNDFKGWAYLTTPKSFQKWFQGGGEFNPPECWGDDHTAYVVTLKGMMSTASPNAVFGWLLALVRGYMSFNVNLINIISTLPPLKLLSSATFSIRPHCRHHYYHHYVMFLTLMFYAYLTYYLSPI